MYEKFLKMGPGSKLPKNPLEAGPKVFLKNLMASPMKKAAPIEGTKKVLLIPDFKPYDVNNEVAERYSVRPDETEELRTQ